MFYITSDICKLEGADNSTSLVFFKLVQDKAESMRFDPAANMLVYHLSTMVSRYTYIYIYICI